MLEGLRLLEVLSRLHHLICVLLTQSLHLADGLPLVNNKYLVPLGSELLQLKLILVLDLNLLTVVLVIERGLESVACLLSNLYNLPQPLLGFVPVFITLVHFAHLVQGVQVSLHAIDVECGDLRSLLLVDGYFGDSSKMLCHTFRVHLLLLQLLSLLIF